MAVQYRSLPIMDILGCPLFFPFPFRYDLLVLQIVPFLNRCCSGSIPIILCGMVSFISRVPLNASCALIFMPYRYVIKNEEDPLLDDPAIQAQQYRIAGKFELAEKAYRDAIKKDPLDVSLYANFGSLLIERKKFDEAEIVLKKAIDTNRAGAITHMNLGFLYLKKKNFPQAQIQSEIAVKLNPESSISWLNLGLAYVHQEKIDQAREAWTRALALDPNNEQLKNNLKVVEDR